MCVCECCKVAKTQREGERERKKERGRERKLSSSAGMGQVFSLLPLCKYLPRRFSGRQRAKQRPVMSQIPLDPTPPFGYATVYRTATAHTAATSLLLRVCVCVCFTLLQLVFFCSAALLPHPPPSPSHTPSPFSASCFLFSRPSTSFSHVSKNFANFITLICYAPFIGHAPVSHTHTPYTHANAEGWGGGQISKELGQVQVIIVNFVCVKVLLCFAA